MGLITFWSVIALSYIILTIVTGKALFNLKQDLSKLDDISPSGIINSRGRAVAVESTLYKTLKDILFIDVFGFLAAAAAAVVSIFTTY